MTFCKEMKILIIISLLSIGQLPAYEVLITDPPTIDALPNSRIYDAVPIEGKTTLIEFLGGEKKIERIVVGVIANQKHGELTREVVRERFDNSVCMDSHKDQWSYAPFASGTIYFVGGGRQSFGLHLSGISVAGHLFALDPKSKRQNKSEQATPRKPSD